MLRGRLMTDDFKLKKRAEKWIRAIRGKFQGVPLEITAPQVNQLTEIGGFKML